MDIWDEKFSIAPEQDNEDTWDNFLSGPDDIGETVYEDTWDRQEAALYSKDFAEKCGSMPNAAPGTREFQKEWRQKTPIERFKLGVNKVALDLNDNSRVITLTKSDRNKMCGKADYAHLAGTPAKYLNPLAYVLGYVVYKGNAISSGPASSSSEVKNMGELLGSGGDIFGELDRINMYTKQDYSVFPADVIRYGRFWKDHLSQV